MEQPTPTPAPTPEPSNPTPAPAAQPAPGQPAPAATPAPTPSADPTPRQLAEAKYKELYGAPASPAPPASPEPAAVPAPSAGLPQELIDTITSLRAEVAELRSSREAPRPASPPSGPAQPAAPEPSWVDLIREGRFDEAKASIIRDAEGTIAPRLASEIQAAIFEQIASQRRFEEFVANVRKNNPDVAEYEDWITLQARDELLALREANPNLTGAEWADKVEQTVNKHVEKTRERIQRIRGAGAIEAQTSNREVLAGATASPSVGRPDAQPAKPPAPKSPAEVIAERQLFQQRLQGSAQV